MNFGYLAAVVVLGGIILFHEFGHYLLARLNGVAVVEFSVGFGPRILSWVSRKTGIRYSLKLLPLGGSCAMLGEFGEDEDEKEEIPDLKGVSFFDRGPLAKMAVIAAGPVFNFILAFVFSLVILSWAGIDPAVIAGTRAQRRGCDHEAGRQNDPSFAGDLHVPDVRWAGSGKCGVQEI